MHAWIILITHPFTHFLLRHVSSRNNNYMIYFFRNCFTTTNVTKYIIQNNQPSKRTIGRVVFPLVVDCGPVIDWRLEQPTKHIYKQPTKHINKQPTKHINKQPTKHINKQPTKHINKQPTKHINKQPTKHINKQPTKHINKQPTKQINKQPTKPIHLINSEFDVPQKELSWWRHQIDAKPKEIPAKQKLYSVKTYHNKDGRWERIYIILS